MKIILMLKGKGPQKYMNKNPELRIEVKNYNDDNNELIDEFLKLVKEKYKVE